MLLFGYITLLKMSNNIYISREVHKHLASHFQQDQPGSKFYCESPEDLLEEGMRLFPGIFQEAKPDNDAPGPVFAPSAALTRK